MTDEPQLRRLALSLLHTAGPLEADLSSLSASDWDRLDAILGEYRLQPLLHAERKDAPVPPGIATGWASAYRTAGLVALRQRAALIAGNRLLNDAGIPAVALKGAWLAWHAYAAPAMRPMRDIDLLVDPGNLAPAWCVLKAAGYTAPFGEPDWDAPLRDKHLPPLLSPDGVMLELHGRAWETDEQAGHAMPLGADGLLARAGPGAKGDGVLYPLPEDTLVHLLVHAVYSHWLDCGPLVLADVDVLLRNSPPCWPSFWRRAEAEGWERGAALVLALADRWRRPGILIESGCPTSIPSELLDAAPDLLLQSPDRRAEARIIARLGRDGVAGLARAKWAEARSHPAHFARTLLRRGAQLLAGASSPKAREKARAMERLGDWLLDG